MPECSCVYTMTDKVDVSMLIQLKSQVLLREFKILLSLTNYENDS